MPNNVYGLLGQHLPHSFSPLIHSFLGDYSYALFEREPEGADEFFKSRPFSGINVTIPYKIKAFNACDKVSQRAKRIGSVNTVCNKNGQLLGYNTDYYGFLHLVNQSGIELRGKKAIILGSGGASLTAYAVLEDLGAAGITVISRNGENNYQNISRHFDAEVIVNTTPVGMFPHNGESPIELGNFKNCEGVIDVIYNPHKTALLLKAEELNIKNIGGLPMLVAQAKQAAELFTEKEIPDEIIGTITSEIEYQTKNIVLIGMPGCGKSSVGLAIAKSLNRPFYDLDEEIVKKAGCSIPQIFESEGEQGFRKIETAVCEEFCKMSGAVIATGGGVVVTKENHNLLRQNSTTVWVKREIAELPTKGRPVSKSRNLEDLYNERRPLYEKLAEHTVQSKGSVQETAKSIIALLKP